MWTARKRSTTAGGLYKFIGDPAKVQFLLKGMVKFTPIHELNDPSELMPTLSVDNVRESLERYRRHGYNDQDIRYFEREGILLGRLAPEFPIGPIPRTSKEATERIRLPAFDDIPMLQRRLSELAQEMRSKVGLFCLSQRFNSLPMWAHYAQNAAGIAVEFRNLNNVFKGDKTGVLRQPIPVRYDLDQIGVSFDPRSHESLFFGKFQDWSYEQEVRVVLPLADCKRAFLEGKQLYMDNLPASCIARVILGWNIAPDKVATVEEQVRDSNLEVEIVQATFVRGRVQLED